MFLAQKRGYQKVMRLYIETAQSRTESWLSVFITLFAKISVHLFLQNGNLEVSWLAPNMPEMRLRNFFDPPCFEVFYCPQNDQNELHDEGQKGNFACSPRGHCRPCNSRVQRLKKTTVLELLSCKNAALCDMVESEFLKALINHKGINVQMSCLL